jgi:hypothetical protein
MAEKHLREHQNWLSLFQPDVLAPLQYLDRWRCRRRQNPETMLMLAVLEDGIASFQKFSLARNRQGQALFREAENWLMGEDNDWLYAFENICDVLGLSPNYIRAGLCRWRRWALEHRAYPRHSDVGSSGGASVIIEV